MASCGWTHRYGSPAQGHTAVEREGYPECGLLLSPGLHFGSQGACCFLGGLKVKPKKGIILVHLSVFALWWVFLAVEYDASQTAVLRFRQ